MLRSASAAVRPPGQPFEAWWKNATASRRSATPSFCTTAEMCARTPLGLSCSRFAISRVESPSARPASTSHSLLVSRGPSSVPTSVVRKRGSLEWNCMTMRATSAGGIAAFPSTTSSSACGRVSKSMSLVGDREHHNLRRRQTGGDLPGGCDPAARHADIEQADVGSRLERLLHRPGRVGRLRAYDKAAVCQRTTHVVAGRCVVVRNEYTEGLGLLRRDMCHEAHSSSSTLVPAPRRVSTRSFPPSASARSFMVTSPKPRRGSASSKPDPSSSTPSRMPASARSR